MAARREAPRVSSSVSGGVELAASFYMNLRTLCDYLEVAAR
jgi:hypothetical protein